MGNEYKWIVLLKGLTHLSKNHFRLFKSLMSNDLRLERSMQEKYTRDQIADMMEDEYPDDAGLGKLIKFCEDLPALRRRAKILKKERSKVIRESSVQKTKQEASPPTTTSNTSHMLASERGKTYTAPAETSAAQVESSTAQKKRKQITKTEGGKKKKLTEEQAQLPETLRTNVKNDVDCVRTPPKSPPPPPPSSSSNKKKKNTTIQKHSMTKPEGPQEKQQLGEFSPTNNFSAVSEIPIFEGCSGIASSRLQSSQNLLEANLDLKISTSFTKSPCQNFPILADSSNHLNSNGSLIHFSGAQVPHVPPATAFSNVRDLHMPLGAVFPSSSAHPMSEMIVPSSTQFLSLPTPAACKSTEASHSQAIASRNAQTTKVPSATLTNTDQLIKMPPPATASSNAQVPPTLATLSRSISVTQVPQTTSSGNQTLNSATVPMVPPATIPNSLTVPPVSMSIAINRAQTTQIHPGTGLICVQALHTPPSTVSRSVCSTHKGAAFCTGKDLSLPKVTSSRNVQASQVSSATTSSSILVPYAISSTASSSILASYASSSSTSRRLQAPYATSATTSSSLQASHANPSKASSSIQAPHGTSSTAFSSHLALQLPLATASRTLHVTPEPSATVHSSPARTPRRGIVPMEPAKEEGHQKGPKQVVVLKVTEIFTYDMKADKRMFHATVATETEFFRVKVFDIALKGKFIPRNIIAISNYFGCDGFLEIYRASCVSDVHDNQTMVISKTLRQRASATPKLSYLFSQRKGTFVNGEFAVFKKTERNKFICYGIKDDTGIMEVVVYGRLTNIRCEPGSKLRLVCFELTSTKHMWQLRSVRHSYMQVINGECEGKPLNPNSGESLCNHTSENLDAKLVELRFKYRK